MNRKKIKKEKLQYVNIKQYTPLKGIWMTVMIQIILMIPIVNILLLAYSFPTKDRGIWEGIFYNKVREYVKEDEVVCDKE